MRARGCDRDFHYRWTHEGAILALTHVGEYDLVPFAPN
jgi:hypothetical protein